MKTRVHIHRETIEAIGEVRHFTVKLPPDTEKVVAFKATASPQPDRPKKNHAETGLLQMKQDGVLFYEIPVWYEGKEPIISRVSAPGAIENRSQPHISGGRAGFYSMDIPGMSTLIFCKHENGGALFNYVLSLYFVYEPKPKK